MALFDQLSEKDISILSTAIREAIVQASANLASAVDISSIDSVTVTVEFHRTKAVPDNVK